MRLGTFLHRGSGEIERKKKKRKHTSRFNEASAETRMSVYILEASFRGWQMYLSPALNVRWHHSGEHSRKWDFWRRERNIKTDIGSPVRTSLGRAIFLGSRWNVGDECNWCTRGCGLLDDLWHWFFIIIIIMALVLYYYNYKSRIFFFLLLSWLWRNFIIYFEI